MVLKRMLPRAIAILLGALFLWTASSLLLDPDIAVGTLARHITRSSAQVLVATAVSVEMLLGCILLFQREPFRAKLLASAILLLAYAGYLSMLAFRGNQSPCGCGLSKAFEYLGTNHFAGILTDLALAGVALLGAWHSRSQTVVNR